MIKAKHAILAHQIHPIMPSSQGGESPGCQTMGMESQSMGFASSINVTIGVPS